MLATGLKILNHKVAITGDDLNDVPALKKADVGFGMKMNASEAALDAS